MRCHQNERVAWVRRPPQRLHRHFFLPSVSTSFSLPCDSASLSVYLSLSLRPPSPESTPMAVSVTSSAALLSAFLLLSSPLLVVLAGNFNRDFDIIWGAGKAKILGNGQLLTLSLDRISGSAFQSKNRFLFGKIGMQLKLVPGNSAGTVTSYYLASEGSTWDEFDFEFLGNLSGQPYTVHTNVIQQGKGDREQQFRLWFDPTADFHTYSILWNPQTIIFYVDGSPIRQFRNLESAGIPFPKKQPMRIHSSLWNADDWATQGGLVKTDWTQAPFRASYRNFFAEACVWPNGASSCSPSSRWQGWLRAGLDAASYSRLRWVQKNYMIYNYCTDTKRFPRGFPPECAHTN